MKPRPTPETDELSPPHLFTQFVPSDFSRRLERERDEERERAEKMREAISELLFDVARAEWKFGRNNDGSPKNWTEWNNIREHLKKFNALRKPEELQPFPHET